MPTSPDPRRKHPGTYIVQNRSNKEEMQRLQLQDHLVNLGMGGPLPEQADPARVQSVLDVGCGIGGWLIELATTYPHISRLAGIDVSSKMLDFARSQAATQGVGERTEFFVMDALRMLEFPDASFDLVNQRAGMSWLRTWDWPKLLQEYRRVTRPGGVIRITEASIPTHSSSAALLQLNELALQAFHQAGHFFQPTESGVIDALARLLHQYGFQDVQTRPYALEYRAGTLEAELFAKDMEQVFRTMQPFLQKWIHLPDDYEAIYQQMVKEMHEPDFVATWEILTAWGTRK